MSSSLLSPEFMRELEGLKRLLEIDVRSGAAGERASRRKGGSAEFSEHRPYEPGDDPRRIDWAAFARSGQPVTKLYRAEEDAAVRLVLDASSSLDLGEPKKLDGAKRIVAAVGYLALAAGQRIELSVARVASDEARAPVARGRTRRGRAAIATLVRELEDIAPGGRTDLAGAVRALVASGGRPGLVVVVSDFLDPGPVLPALTLARSIGHEVAALMILDPSELAPELSGDHLLEDSETGETLELTADPAAISAYSARLDALFDTLRGWARRAGGTFLRTTQAEPLSAVMRRFVSRSID
jgi:uncharacterized protein (DUF58 family)